MRLRTPLRKRGVTTERWARWRDKNRAIVAARARGRCEGCGATDGPRELHHCFGRSHIISEPWASLAAMCASLCLPCHRDITNGGDPYLTLQMRSEALWRLRDQFGGLLPMYPDLDAVEVARLYVSALSEEWEFDPDRCAVVRR